MIGFLKRVFSEYSKDKAGQMSAAFAYVAVFSIGPLLLVLVSIVGFVYGEQAASGQLFGRLSSAVGPDTAKTLQHLVANVHTSGGGVAALVVGTLFLLLTAAALTAQLQNSFDSILRAVPDPRAGIKFTVYTKLKNITVVILGSLIALASVIASALVTGLEKSVGLELLNSIVSLLIFIIVLFFIYRVLPDVTIPSLLALKTAVAVSLMFLVGKVVLGVIIGHNGAASAYGAAASLVVLLLWFYYSAQILFLGAEGMKVYGENHKVDFLPKRYTVKQKELDVFSKHDIRGRLLEAFSRGYKTKSRKS